MTETFRAIRVTRRESAAPDVTIARLSSADLPEGEVVVAIRHSTVNYKDALALTGRAPILRRSPMTPGIDFAGEVLHSASTAFKPGDHVVLNGWGVGEDHDGGLAERAQVMAAWLIPLPDGLTTAQAMAIGTAGYTAALSVLTLEQAGIESAQGGVLVTGAAGGVGSIAVALLAAAGYHVIASSRRVVEEQDYLRGIGAAEVLDARDLGAPGRPLGKERWAAAIDCAGSHTLVNALAHTRSGGVVAACGLAQGPDLPATVMPFILRGVTLAGIESSRQPLDRRLAAWARLARHLHRDVLAEMTSHISLDEVPAVAADLLAGTIRGRVVVDL